MSGRYLYVQVAPSIDSLTNYCIKKSTSEESRCFHGKNEYPDVSKCSILVGSHRVYSNSQ